MIYEVRTYTLRPGTVAEFEERFENFVFVDQRKTERRSQLASQRCFSACRQA